MLYNHEGSPPIIFHFTNVRRPVFQVIKSMRWDASILPSGGDAYLHHPLKNCTVFIISRSSTRQTFDSLQQVDDARKNFFLSTKEEIHSRNLGIRNDNSIVFQRNANNDMTSGTFFGLQARCTMHPSRGMFRQVADNENSQGHIIIVLLINN